MSEAKKRTEFADLTPEQQDVVSVWGQGLAVLAGAGCGKTTTLVMKCAELMNRKPDARFAAVSFTERSASDLKEKLSDRLDLAGEGSALSGHWVMTIHALCASIIREYPREAGFDGEETMLSEPESAALWERATQALWVEELPPEVQSALELLMDRESRTGVLDLLKRVRELDSFGVLSRLSASEDAASRALSVTGRYVLERYDRQKRRRGVLDFNDLERGADRALEVPAVREHYQRRFDLVLVDEFQDTNPLQASIIWRFVKPDLSNLCVVGDPKQSIYRFRDADVSVFEDCCSRLPKRLSLTWNFRSRPGIIDFANRVCAPCFEASDMPYEPLQPKRVAAESGEAVEKLEIRTPGDLGAWVAAERERGVPLHEMALLLRKVRGNEKWLKALTAAGIPIAVGSGGLFWEDPRVRELTSFLKWWENPGNAFSGAVFLRAPWVGIDDVALDAWVRQDPTWVAPFFASAHPLARALLPFRDRPVRPGELLLELLVDARAEEELGAPLLGLWHRAEDLSSRGLDFRAVVQELARAMEDSRRERDVPPPQNLGQLTVLTLHGSKGLEFPHVLLLDFPDKPARAQNAPLLFWDREKGVYLAGRTESGDRDRKNEIEDAWKRAERAKELAECKRLFYVALTRARERLVLVLPPDAEPKPMAEAKPAGAGKSGARKKTTEPSSADDDEESSLERDYWRGWVKEAVLTIPPAQGGVAPARPQAGASGIAAIPSFSRRRPSPPQKRARHSVTEWNTLSRCERAYEWTFVRPLPVAEGVPEIGLFTGRKVAQFSETEITQQELGTRVHACLETADFDGLRALEKEVGEERFVAEPVISWALSSPLMRPAAAAEASGDPGAREVHTELAFEIPVAGEILVGSIDRLVAEEREGGAPHFTLIDFKVTEKLKSVDTLTEAYGNQLHLYAWAVAAIEPRARQSMDAVLVNISARTVQTVPVELRRDTVEGIARRAGEIVAGAKGLPKVGALCRICEFRARCPEGTAFSSPQ